MCSYMGQQEHGVSDGLYTYKHHHEGGADIHTIFVKKSKFRILLSYISTMFLLASVCRALFSKVAAITVGGVWSGGRDGQSSTELILITGKTGPKGSSHAILMSGQT